ncbi:MAG: CPBP family intramembrane metalloprotease [Rhodospirillaceae bacterium]|nr:CPBP family intramembrane metalloprotease [Rhodospirillaceae bacterium]MBT3492526.1 CPBP family intramembrane metalloprotease [Rhodospirillaceae bacterium]MBT3782395.1 CPBP family intramembrane metalloprotease [Rhodospirillaceae bacterium]MBT3979022.1 CPBP family intramembrane metalloprotease [Rhodospirillaceae bacterium]MBT4565102.1 CPBP family intramembrane metalloprotease [Rhodospirillaceae bacterium]
MPINTPPSIATRQMSLALMGAIIVQLAAALWGRRLLGAEHGPAAMLLAYLVVPSLAAIIWLWFAAVWRERDGWSRLGFAWIDRRWLLRAVALGLLSVPVLMLVTAITKPVFGPAKNPALPLSGAEAWSQPSYLLMLFLGIVVLAPLMEEMIFRGLLFGWLRRHLGLWQAAALAALGHAILHFDLGALPGLFALFLFLAWIYEYSQSLWVPAIIHAVHNFAVLQLP